ncbi:dynein axonemal heavy chain 3-like [Adelges cooleyi]|uniref:dynein axonemal heavy chain 3-like n=1 Tax=Adelges cooleyi TaxID=133065 RepID=UPI0021800B14|nr:dynein axonemal heavy chain 3-like [Adelges cooleyi]
MAHGNLMLDLLSGKYHEERAKVLAESRKTEENKKAKTTKKTILPQNYRAFLQTCAALNPDEQLDILKNKWRNVNRNQTLTKEDSERINYYLNNGITDDAYERFPQQVLVKLKKNRVELNLIKKHSFIAANLDNEVRHNYTTASRKIILDYILKDPDELKRLQITKYHLPEHPTMLVRGPVPWHHMTAIKREQLRHSLYIFKEPILMLDRIWEKYSEGFIFSIDTLKTNGMPIGPVGLQEFLDKSCRQFRSQLVNKWLVECAELFKDTRHLYRDVLPARGMEVSKYQVDKFFDCVSATMSRQLRQIVFKSLNHFMEYIHDFKDGNALNTEYKENMFINWPFFILKAIPDPSSTKILFEPSYEVCLDLLLSIPKEIVKTVEDMPRIEQLLIKELKGDSTMVLKNVYESEEEVQTMLLEIRQILENNFPGPEKYITYYQTYTYLIDGTEAKLLDDFFSIEPFPLLNDFNDWVIKYTTIKDSFCNVKNQAQLNLMMLDVSESEKSSEIIGEPQKKRSADFDE